MKLDITKEDIKELLDISILPKSNLSERAKHLDQFPLNINETTNCKDLRYYIAIEIHTIFAADRSLTQKDLIVLHGSAFDKIVDHYIDRDINNKSYYEIDDLVSDLFHCLNKIQEDINYITVWE